MKYDPVAYWNSRKNPNSSDVAPAWIHDYIRPFAKGVDRAFELGPGVGRTFDIYDRGAHIVTLDLSKQYAERLRARAEAIGLELTQNFLLNPEDIFPFEDCEFRLGVCAQVLMHVLPEHIVHSMKELSRICDRTVVVAGVNDEWSVRPSHCFNHDYLGICKTIGCVADSAVLRKDSICFVMRKNLPLVEISR